MKISLDAAMRARDVSSTGWRDDASLDRDEPARNVNAARTMRAVASARASRAVDALEGGAETDSAATDTAETDRTAVAAPELSGPPLGDASARTSVPPKPETGESNSASTQADGRDQRRRANGPRRRRRTRLRRDRPT